MEPCFLTASEASAQIGTCKLSVEELVHSCLARIGRRDPQVRAWLHLEPELAIRRARELDKRQPVSPVHGLPVGIKDVIDTFDMPTTQNSAIYADARIGRDAACVAAMRHSGALILGKTDTVEFAAGGRKALTTNPWNAAHTPGGSSSGSAAAVGDWMVPLAFGTQTAGSLIRPASFNGIYGLKPTHGVVSREGVRMSSHSLDTVGWFGRSVADLALVAQVFRLMGIDKRQPVALKGLKVGLCCTPVWNRAEPAARDALFAAAKRLEQAGAFVHELELPRDFSGLFKAQQIIENGEGRAAFLPEYLGAYELLAPDLRDKVENTSETTALSMIESYTIAETCRPQFDRMFDKTLDVILTPASCGEAPHGLETTGDPLFNRIWSLLHAPCIAIPAAYGAHDLPIGVQIVGPRFSDAQLLSIAEAMAPAIDIMPRKHGLA
jgi:Asp-tRNA(Asn)/Glu-tRNA(Gln) amidotransferase A subunit family amidase